MDKWAAGWFGGSARGTGAHLPARGRRPHYEKYKKVAAVEATTERNQEPRNLRCVCVSLLLPFCRSLLLADRTSRRYADTPR